MGSARIGISGWNYPPRRGVFYPKGRRQKDELAYASGGVDSIEVNGSFYSLLRPHTAGLYPDFEDVTADLSTFDSTARLANAGEPARRRAPAW